MAIIYTYPRLNTVNNGDLLLISAVNTTRKPTMRVRVEDLKSYMTKAGFQNRIEKEKTNYYLFSKNCRFAN